MGCVIGSKSEHRDVGIVVIAVVVPSLPRTLVATTRCVMRQVLIENLARDRTAPPMIHLAVLSRECVVPTVVSYAASIPLTFREKQAGAVRGGRSRASRELATEEAVTTVLCIVFSPDDSQADGLPHCLIQGARCPFCTCADANLVS